LHFYARAPFTKGGKISNEFSLSHRAKDIVPRLDDSDDVVAVEDGTVSDTQSGQSPGDSSPNMVIVRGIDGALTVYGHVDPSVFSGWSISMGDVIGTVDMSGQTSGKHVHLARLPVGTGTVDDVESREPKQGVNYAIRLK
jgi:murein DD-endopeptidase MepM/ murein hydrolase activator NlpD